MNDRRISTREQKHAYRSTPDEKCCGRVVPAKYSRRVKSLTRADASYSSAVTFFSCSQPLLDRQPLFKALQIDSACAGAGGAPGGRLRASRCRERLSTDYRRPSAAAGGTVVRIEAAAGLRFLRALSSRLKSCRHADGCAVSAIDRSPRSSFLQLCVLMSRL